MKMTQENEAYEVAKEFVAKNSTIRKVAIDLEMSKSTVHKRLIDFMEFSKVREQDRVLAKQVRYLIEKNKQERSFRGGNATKTKFLKLKTEKAKVK